MSYKDISYLVNKTLILIPNNKNHINLERLLLTLEVPSENILIINQVLDREKEIFFQYKHLPYLQVGSDFNLAQMYNIGINYALEKDYEFVCILQPDTEVQPLFIHQLLETLSSEENVGICSPAKILQLHNTSVVYGMQWQLDTCSINPEFISLCDKLIVQDVDFCDFTCAIIPTNVFRKIGLFDPNSDDVELEIDFNYRLWLAGYRAVCDQRVQVISYSLSLNDNLFDKQDYFKNKFLKYGLHYQKRGNNVGLSWHVIEENLSKYIRKYGLLDYKRPELCLGHPDEIKTPYLITLWETTDIPKLWEQQCQQFEHIFLCSNWNVELFKKAGVKNVSYLPLGICPLVYHPYGHRFDFGDKKIYLFICENQYRKALDVTIKIWQETKDHMPHAWLYLFGKHINPDLIGKFKQIHKHNKLKYYTNFYDRIVYIEPLEFLSFEEMAQIYRSAYVLVNNSRSEGFGLSIIEAMACGVPCVFPDYSATAEFIVDSDSLAFKGKLIEANYVDKGFANVGYWWEPSVKDLQKYLIKSYYMSDFERKKLIYKSRQFVLKNFTWRNTMLRLRSTLEIIQQDSNPILSKLTDKKIFYPTIQKKFFPEKLIAVGDKIKKLGEAIEKNGYKKVLNQCKSYAKNKLFNSQENHTKNKDISHHLEQLPTEIILKRFEKLDDRNYSLRNTWYCSENPKISILLLNYNKSTLTIRCIKEIWRHTKDYSYEIIVIDNGSNKDDFINLKKAKNDFCKIIRLEKNRYFAEGCNIAAGFAKGEYLFFLNNDAFVTKEWLAPLVDTVQQEDIGIVGPMFLYPDGRLQEAGAHIDKQGNTLFIGHGSSPDAPEFNIKKEVDYISGAGFLIKNTLFNSVLGFDFLYEHGYYEDVDLCFKIKAMNKKILYCPQSKIIHIKNVTSLSNRDFAFSSIEKNAIMYLSRWKYFFANKNNNEIIENFYHSGIINFDRSVNNIAFYIPFSLKINAKLKLVLAMILSLNKDNTVTVFFDEYYSQLTLQYCFKKFGFENFKFINIKKISEVKNDDLFDVFISVDKFIEEKIVLPVNKKIYLSLFSLEKHYLIQHQKYLDQYSQIITCSNYFKNEIELMMEKNLISTKSVQLLFTPINNIKNKNKEFDKIMIMTVSKFIDQRLNRHIFNIISSFVKVHFKTKKNVELHIAGMLEHPRFYHELKSIAVDFPIYFYPNACYTKLQDLYEKSHIYWHAKDIQVDKVFSENLHYSGAAVLEAMSYGCVPLINADGGLRELLVDGEDSLYYSDERSLVSKTLDLIENKSFFEKISNQSFNKARKFSMENFSNELKNNLIF